MSDPSLVLIQRLSKEKVDFNLRTCQQLTRAIGKQAMNGDKFDAQKNNCRIYSKNLYRLLQEP